MKTQWNTGRQYADEGQRIVAGLVEGGIIFKDFTRHIDGFMPCVVGHQITQSVITFRDFVMFLYDHGAYQYDARAKELFWQ